MLDATGPPRLSTSVICLPMPKRKQVIFSLLLAAAGVAGCGRMIPPLPDGPGERVTEMPAQSELVGTWQLTDESVAGLKREGFKGDLSGRSHTISLKADGKCDVHAYYWYGVDSTSPPYISAPGTWTIEVKKEVVKYVVLTIQWGDTSSQTNWGVFDMRLARDGGRLVFWSFMTDPDMRMYYEFAKKKDI